MKLFVLLTAVACNISGFPQSVSDYEERTFVSCRDSNDEFRLNLIPHPNDCSTFFQCEPIPLTDGGYATAPVTSQKCPLDENGLQQNYDFRQCRCLRQQDALCYDHTSPGHKEDYFICTVPFIMNLEN